jgi:hypothetical protein
MSVIFFVHTTGNPLSKRPKPTSAITGAIPRGLKNLKYKKQCSHLIGTIALTLELKNQFEMKKSTWNRWPTFD